MSNKKISGKCCIKFTVNKEIQEETPEEIKKFLEDNITLALEVGNIKVVELYKLKLKGEEEDPEETKDPEDPKD